MSTEHPHSLKDPQRTETNTFKTPAQALAEQFYNKQRGGEE